MTIQEIYPSLYVIGDTTPGAKVPYTYLLKRPAGNILLATQADLARFWDALLALGPISHILLGDRHHAGAPLDSRLGVPLSMSAAEAKAVRSKGVTAGIILRDARHFLADDLEVIPTPGHTPGALSFLWSNAGKRFLFIGDTLVPIDGRWEFWVTRPNYPKMRATAEMLRGVAFDTILSNSFACSPTAWFDQTSEQADDLLRSVIARLS